MGQQLRNKALNSTIEENHLYNEYRPSHLLQPFVECYWSYHSELPAMQQKRAKPVVPDGCVDIIFDLTPTKSEGCYVIGAMTRAISNTKTDLWGIRFRPGMAFGFLNIPMTELTDKKVDLLNFFDSDVKHISEQLSELTEAEHRIQFLNEFLLKRNVSTGVVDLAVHHAISLIKKSKRNLTINDISRAVGWSRQHLKRRFGMYTGLTPKQFSQVMQIQTLIKLYHPKTFTCWSETALIAGFFDQSHMINTFKKFTGLTPIDYLSK